jgi:cation diffusion facilitator CzcD-associated flavoprotein CzcO
MPEKYGNFPSAKNVFEYLNNYADHFGLRENIRFKTRITLVEPVTIADQELFEVTLESGDKHLYKGIIVANGHHWVCRITSFLYTYKFPGQTISQAISRRVYWCEDAF